MHEPAMLVLLQQCVDAFVQQNRSVGEHGDKIHGEKFQSFEKRNSVSHTHLPVRLHGKNFRVQLTFNKTLKVAKNLKDIGSLL